ncbi:hypothetical protein GCM10023222_06790 [Saccharopolyspora cebuensis]
MQQRARELVVLLRKAQWLLDDMAYELGGGRLTPEQQDNTTEALGELVEALKAETSQQSSARSRIPRSPSGRVRREHPSHRTPQR